MMRCISDEDRQYYTDMQEVIAALGGEDLPYQWLISDFEISSEESWDEKPYLLLSSHALIRMLRERSIQWIWAVFSAIPNTVRQETILSYPLPTARDNTEIYKNDAAIIQHPLADMEIVAEDSSSVFLVSKVETYLDRFKELFPLSKPNF